MQATNAPNLFNDTITTWVDVILPLTLPNLYSYSVPNLFLPKIKIGCRVEVQLKNKKYSAIIARIHNKQPTYNCKTILNVLDDEPLVYPNQLELWQWIADYYMCSQGEVMAAALPTNFKLSSEAILVFNEAHGDNFEMLPDNEYLVAEALQLKKELRVDEIQQIIDNSNIYPVVKKLIDAGICFIWESLEEKYKAKTENFVVLTSQYNNEVALAELLNNWKGAPKQMELLLAYLHFSKTKGEVVQTALLKKANATTAQLTSLVEKNILQIEKRNVDRIHLPKQTIDINFELSVAQQQALQQVQTAFTQQPVCLLHGVTGSGKTQIYIKLIEKAFNQGKQVLYLLPEIALTTQIIRRLQIHFGGNITIYHSKFNNHERVELWHKVRTGSVKIILGARSSLLLPFNNLGLIIVDEEHDTSYKQQEPAPKYNARDTAIFYALKNNAKVLLGSATPSIESYFNAKQGKYGLVTLAERFGGLQLPNITFVDTKQINQKGKVLLSPQLQAAIQKTLQAGKQVILFQNRRGYNPYLICGSCGFIPQCKHCSVSLTLHKYSNKLHCHYCASKYPKIPACTACGAANWTEKNYGTEKIEEHLEETFADYKIGRMDVDSIRGKKAHNELIAAFEQQRLHILVGTQMVVKGLDFDNVSLVGVLDADGILGFADFRVNERSFQLIEQVSGRAGRKGTQGQVIIQTSNPSHKILQHVHQHNFTAMYTDELEARQIFLYPPYTRLLKLTLKHKSVEVVQAAATSLANSVQQDMRNLFVGPAAPMVSKIKNLYLMEILFKLPKNNTNYKQIIKTHIQILTTNTSFKSVQTIIDVDPI
jgi:primosomal protein N' (replication factor Y) (superfamily II helicase)